MREPIPLVTFDRPENATQLRVAIERTDDGRSAVTLRIWRKDASGVHQPTKFGASVRRAEIGDLIRALDLAEEQLDLHPDPTPRLAPRERMRRFLDDAEQLTRAAIGAAR